MSMLDSSICYTIDLQKSPIDIASIFQFRKWEEEGVIQLFKLKNGSTRVVVCIEKNFHDAVIEGSSFLLKRGVDVDMLKDNITMIKIDQLIEEISK